MGLSSVLALSSMPLGPSTMPLAAGLDMPLEWVVGLGFLLFAVGVLGVACRRNILIMLLSVEIMLNAANVVLVAFSRIHSDLSGQVMVFFSMTVAAAEVAIGLAIVIAVYRLRQSADVDDAADLHEVDYGPVPPLKLEGEDQHHDDHDTPESAEPVGAAGES